MSVIELPHFSAVTKYLNERGITEEIRDKYGIQVGTVGMFKTRLGQNSDESNTCIHLVHYDIDGEPLTDWGCGVQFPPPTGFMKASTERVLRKRWGISGRGVRVWLNPHVDWSKPPEGGWEIDLCESVLKAILPHVLLGHPTIGLNGVNTGSPGHKLHPLLDKVLHADDVKSVRIIFDDDTESNSRVKRAQDELAGLIQERGIEVIIHNAPDGMDDLNNMLHIHGEEWLTRWLEVGQGQTGKFTGLPGALRKLNTEVCLVRNGSYLYEIDTGIKMTRSEFVGVNYADRIVLDAVLDGQGEVKKLNEISVATKWLQWPEKLAFKEVTFRPGREHMEEGGEFINSWQEHELEPVGSSEDAGSLRVVEFIRGQIGEGNDAIFHRFMQTLAWNLRNPGRPPMNYIVMVSAGIGHTGKSLVMAGLYGPMFGKWFWSIDQELWSGAYTPYYYSQCVLFEEAYNERKTAKANEAKIKSQQTANNLAFNDKYDKAVQIPRSFLFVVTSNDMDSMPITTYDRRAFVVEFGVNPARGHASMAAEADWVSKVWMADGHGPARFKRVLLDWDLTGYDPDEDAMMTRGKQVMQENAASPMDLFVVGLSLDASLVDRRYYTAMEIGDLYLVSMGPAHAMEAKSAHGLAKMVSRVMSNKGYVCSDLIKLGKAARGKGTLTNGRFWDVTGGKNAPTSSIVNAHIANLPPSKY